MDARADGCGPTSTCSASSSSSTSGSGYGTSYVTGKYLIDELIKDRAHQLGDGFTLHRFFDEFNGAGMIPVTLIRRQLTGLR